MAKGPLHHAISPRLPAVPRWLRLVMLVGALLFYPAALLWPYDWEPPRQIPNGAELLPDGGVRFESPGIARTGDPPAWLPAAIEDNRLKLSLSVRTASSQQGGPARVLTISGGPYHRDLTVAQSGDHLILRVRTPDTSGNGTIDGRPLVRVANVFQTTKWVDIAISIEPRQIAIAIDGRLRALEGLPARSLQEWSVSYPLALGNELSGNRPWLGSIRQALVEVDGFQVDYAAPGEVHRPPRYWHVRNYPKLVPFRDSSAEDLLVNLVLFVPLGLLLGSLLRTSGVRASFAAIGAIALLSSTLETLQLFISVRNPSIDDFMLNAFGGALGVGAAQGLTRLSAGASPPRARSAAG